MESSAKTRSVAPSARTTRSHRRHRPPRPLFDDELAAVPAVGDVQVVAGEPDRPRSPLSASCVGAARQSGRGVDQERAENVEHPREPLDGGRAQRNKDAAENQRDHDADEQGFALIDPGHAEARHDDDEDEQVVDRQAVLGEPAREELDARTDGRERTTSRFRSTPRARCRPTSRSRIGASSVPRTGAPSRTRRTAAPRWSRQGDNPLQQGDVHGIPPVVDNQRSLPPPRPKQRPAGRSPDAGRRDDDSAAEEYSPPPAVCQVGRRRSMRRSVTAVSIFEP